MKEYLQKLIPLVVAISIFGLSNQAFAQLAPDPPTANGQTIEFVGEGSTTDTDGFRTGTTFNNLTIIINDGETVEINPNSFDMGQNFAGIFLQTESNTVNNAGTIIGGIRGVSVSSNNANNTINNSGMITGDFQGILLSNNTTVNNSGLIVSNSFNGIQFSEGSNNTITNSGTILANENGISVSSGSVSSDNTITNTGSGSIGTSTNRVGVHGIQANGDNNVIDNDGSIYSTLDGINVTGDSNEISNTSAETINASQDGIEVNGDFNEVLNTGTITADGVGIVVIGDVNTINNTASGEIGTGTADEDRVGQEGILVVGNNNEINNFGSIYSERIGIEVTGDLNKIINTNTETIDAESIGIYVDGGFNEVLNSGSIIATSDGIYIEGSGNDVINSGDVDAGGSGIGALGDTNTITNSADGSIGNIENFVGGDGINVVGSSNEINNLGSIYSTGDGIDVTGDLNNILNLSADTINAAEGNGVLVNGNVNDVLNSGEITAGLDGINVTGAGNEVINSGTIDAVGNGVVIDGDSNDVLNSGNIITAADGINATGAGNEIINSGSIDAEDGNGIVVAGDANVITNTATGEIGAGEVPIAQDGINVTGSSNEINNLGLINSLGNGIYVEGDLNDIVNTSADTIEASADGILIVGDANNVLNSGDITAVLDGIDVTGSSNEVINSGSIDASTIGGGGIVVNGDTNTITNTATGDIGTSDVLVVGYGINVTGSSNEINNFGSIYSQQTGVYVTGDLNTITNASDMFEASDGIYVEGNSNQVENIGTINAGRGLSVSGDFNQVENTEVITDAFDGIDVLGISNYIDNSGEIGPGSSTGIYALGAGNVLVNNSTGTIGSDLDRAGLGIYYQDSGEFESLSVGEIQNSGEIYTSGPGILLENFSESNIVNITNSGVIDVESGDGILAIGVNTQIINTAGAIIDAGSNGIDVRGDNSTITNAGVINADGESGIFVEGDFNHIDNSGAINNNNFGIYVDGPGNTVINNSTGTIGSEGARSSEGIRYEDSTGESAVINIENHGEIYASQYGIYLEESSGLTTQITNSGLIDVDSFEGISVFGSDTRIVNTAGAMINSASIGINSGDRSDISNSGTITSTFDNGIGVGSESTVINTAEGIINAESSGIEVFEENEITNSGAINAGFNGIEAFVENEITNSGAINAGFNGIEAFDENEITNSGAINAESSGIEVFDENEITNSGAINAGFNGIEAFVENEITNSGAINAGSVTSSEFNGGNGIEIIFDNVVTNAATGTIDATVFGIVALSSFNEITNAGIIGSEASIGFDGINADASDNTITNSGTINATRNGIVLGTSGNQVTNTGTIVADTGAGILAGDDNFSTDGTSGIFNEGEIIATEGNGIQVGASNLVSNAEDATIDAGANGIVTTGGGNFIINFGEIHATSSGIVGLGNSNMITNDTTGSIGDSQNFVGADGIQSTGNFGGIFNDGSIYAAQDGIDVIGDENLIVNTSDETIVAEENGVIMTGLSNDFNNQGTITADEDGISVSGMFNIVENTGTVNAGGDGIYINGFDNEVYNSGLIVGDIGANFADVLSFDFNLLVNESTAVMTGNSGLAIDGGTSSGLLIINQAGSVVNGDIWLQGVLDQSGTVNGNVTNDGIDGIVYGNGLITGDLTMEGATLSPGSDGGIFLPEDEETPFSTENESLFILSSSPGPGEGVIGTLTVDGVLTLDDAIYTTDLEDAPNSSDRVIADSRIIEGDSRLNILTEDDLLGGQNAFLVIDADEGTPGNFTVDPTFTGSVNPYVWQDGGQIVVMAFPETFTDFATNSAQTLAAESLDSAIDALGDRVSIADSSLGRLATAVNLAADPAAALDQLFPQTYDAFSTTNFITSKNIGSAIFLHLQGLRHDQREREAGWNVWGEIILNETSHEPQSSGVSDYAYDTYSNIVGIDYTCPYDKIVMGAILATSAVDIDWDDVRGSGDTDAYHLGGYFSAENDYFYMDASLIYTGSDHDVDRRVGVIEMLDTDPLFSQFAYSELFSSDTSGDMLGLSALVGKQFDDVLGFGCLIDPQLRLDYAISDLNSFKESGSSGESLLAVTSNDPEYLDATLQVNLAKNVAVGEGVSLIPEVLVGWTHSFDVNDGKSTAQFAGSTESFQIAGDSGDNGDSLLLTIGSRALFSVKNLPAEVSLHYNGTTGARGDQQNFFGRLNLGF